MWGGDGQRGKEPGFSQGAAAQRLGLTPLCVEALPFPARLDAACWTWASPGRGPGGSPSTQVG